MIVLWKVAVGKDSVGKAAFEKAGLGKVALGMVVLGLLAGCTGTGGPVKESVTSPVKGPVTSPVSKADVFPLPASLLPDSGSLPCCWQALERLDIDFHQQPLQLTAVSASNGGRLSVVILDPLGRRLVTIVQEGTEVRVDQSPDLAVALPVNWLLAGIFLRYLPDSGWNFAGSSWQVAQTGATRLLKLDGRIRLRLTPFGIGAQNPVSDRYTARLDYPGLELSLKITTLSRQEP